MSKSEDRRSAFTLVELVVVIVIIGALASFGVPRFLKSMERTRAAEALQFLDAVRSAQERYKAREGSYAGRLADLQIQWRIDPATGEPILKYFRVAEMASDGATWSARLARSGPSGGYAYDVCFDEKGFDAARSTIGKYPEIDPGAASPGATD